ncbi:MAG TPA: type I-B CRISPR-associated protein Cas7/Csh2 [bacterium]|nr:type I-B CRISPR-associated protein Cas7/Csh2 [bacterium]HPN43936.1 type I-B CRISPR-associated protein Cas7/Csh2 [bacterium]
MTNSDILFIYDAQLCNPNGDPDEENRPRMDYPTQTNLVSDVRLKRYIRDYFQDKGEQLYIQKGDNGEVFTAAQRIQTIIKQSKVEKFSSEEIKKILDTLIDIRMFGATIPSKGQSLAFTGPVQFNWGFSLNKAYLLETQTITSHLGAKEGGEQGTMGKDYRIKYSLIAFSGIISGFNAKHTQLSENDINNLDVATIKSIPLHATRSKIGQEPRLYIRAEYTTNDFILGDFRKWIRLQNNNSKKDDEIFSAKDVTLDISALIQKLNENSQKINKIVFWKSDALQIQGSENDIKKISILNL